MNFEYISILGIENYPTVFFEEISEFKKIKKRGNNKLFVDKEDSYINKKDYMYQEAMNLNIEKSGFFIYTHAGIAYKIKSFGFKNIDDYLHGKKLGFEVGYKYYIALRMGCKSLEDLILLKKFGYKHFRDYNKAITNGFINTSAKVYYEAITNGFYNYEEYKKAKELRIATKIDYDDYINSINEMTKYNFSSYEELLLLDVIKKLRSNTKISTTRIEELLKEKIKKKYNKKIPYKFNKSSTRRRNSYMSNDSDFSISIKLNIREFLARDVNIQLLGTYDHTVDIFERTIDNKNIDYIIIDGSNVAWNDGNKSNGDKPLAKNIQIMIEHLNNTFSLKKLICIVDKATKYKIKDYNLYEQLLFDGKVVESPAKTDADHYILDIVKLKNAYVVTNDTFKKDYCQKDEWVKLNINKFRIPFMIIDEEVTLNLDN